MARTRTFAFRLSRLAVITASLALAATAGAATITIVNNDGPGEGFNDATVVAPVGGNPGTTLGAQRLNLFQHAANIWGGILPSTVTILVRSQFDPLPCDATSAVLGSAGPTTIHANFSGAILTNHWYHQALANRLSGVDQSAANPDINATFNSTLDAGTCLGGAVFYYGFDGNEGSNVELLPVLLHEMGHGLGFSSTTDGTSGNFNTGLPGAFDHFLLDNVTGQHWDSGTESAAQRAASAISVDQLRWDGQWGIYGAQHLLAHPPQFIVSAPAGIAGTYSATAATFGGTLTTTGITSQVVLVNDGVGTTSDGCDAPFVNAGALAGNIALIDRGNCAFVIKAQLAQNAGAVAVLIANNTSGALAPGGTQPTITIPVVGISQADGNTIKANLGTGVTITLRGDPASLAGADASGRPLMYAPNPFQSGSSVSHWDVSLTPNMLMEPAINNDLHDQVDLTQHAFVDLGWADSSTPTQLATFTAEDESDGILIEWEFGDLTDVGTITIERATSAEGPWAPIRTQLGTDGGRTTALDTDVEAGVTYYYRLAVGDRSGHTSYYGMVLARHSTDGSGPAALFAPSPNPASKGATIAFRLPRPEFVRLSISDAAGRRVRSLAGAVMASGEHALLWDGASDDGRVAAPGLYFVSLVTSEGRHMKRLAVVR